MIKKPFKSELQSLIYNLFWCKKVIKNLQQKLLNSKNETETYLINGELQEYKQHKINFLREINKIQKG